jgi:hypothetical protein
MTYAARPADFRNNTPYSHSTAPAVAPQPGFFSRLVSAVFASRERQAEREVEAYLARSGNRFTDSIEREINDHLFSSRWNARH